MRYATPHAFRQALEARIRREAVARGQPIPRVRQLLVFDRFLARTFAGLGEQATVKGGVALELRLARARTTRDLDLRVTGRLDRLLDVLDDVCARDHHDYFSFGIAVDPAHPVIEGDGIVYGGRRFRVEANLAGKIYGEPFGVDAAVGDVLTVEPDVIDGTDFFEFAGLERSTYRVYPRETHVAEKLHAFTLPRRRENTRVKDLPDLALLAMSGSFDAATLRRAVDATFAFRATHEIPEALPSAPTSWTVPYASLSERDALPWPDIAELESAVRAFLDPLLGGVDGTWDPELRRWTTR